MHAEDATINGWLGRLEAKLNGVFQSWPIARVRSFGIWRTARTRSMPNTQAPQDGVTRPSPPSKDEAREAYRKKDFVLLDDFAKQVYEQKEADLADYAD